PAGGRLPRLLQRAAGRARRGRLVLRLAGAQLDPLAVPGPGSAGVGGFGTPLPVPPRLCSDGLGPFPRPPGGPVPGLDRASRGLGRRTPTAGRRAGGGTPRPPGGLRGENPMDREALRTVLRELIESAKGEECPALEDGLDLRGGVGLDSIDLASLLVEAQ